ncbi:MAG: 2-oxo acid dehydrogenase subunit E2, partial [Thermoplasmata archaeon]|nr:2-oxo acid dehydrogenase subunit E2 [Thermoplasmata archaeon]NIY03235.1 2-oxo acid dehydrogenase subunit E2 [Thermoplasmata archaeon]
TSRPRATPAARRIARERGVPLRDLAGSGPRGRIQAQDVASFQIPQDGKEEPLTKIRRTIAERMTRSFRDVPHFQVELDVDMTRLEALRTHLNEQAPPRISTTAVLVKATGWALSHHPKLRARYQDERIVISERIHIGVAVALEEGLIVPVIRDADQKGLAQIADELSSLSEKAQAGRLSSSDLSEGTFTISNLGMFGVDRFTAIINPPEAAILAVGRSRDRVVPDPTRGTGFAVRPMITLRLSCDHRVLDGAVAAQFLTDLGKAIEEPGWLAY